MTVHCGRNVDGFGGCDRLAKPILERYSDAHDLSILEFHGWNVENALSDLLFFVRHQPPAALSWFRPWNSKMDFEPLIDSQDGKCMERISCSRSVVQINQTSS